MEERLAQYRKRKKKEEEFAALKQKIWEYFATVFTFWKKDENPATVSTPLPDEDQPQSEEQEPSSHDLQRLNDNRRRRKGSVREDVTTQEDDPPPPHYTRLDWVVLFLKVIMWLLVQKVFILLEFGAVFFIFSAFLFIWYNLRNEPKKKGEASAYSVFNPNCEVIDGTFTAEQFERELLHKM